MMGRYGGDHLSIALILLSILLSFVSQLTRLTILAFISYVPLILSIFRMFSRNIEKRRMENYKFAMLMSPVYKWFYKMQRRAIDSKTHRYFKCPNCRSSLRVPKGKGKIIITCPKCKTEFKKKT